MAPLWTTICTQKLVLWVLASFVVGSVLGIPQRGVLQVRTAEVADVQGLRDAFSDATIETIVLLNSLWLDSDTWPGQPEPIRIGRSVLVTSPEAYGSTWTSVQLNYLTRRIQLAPQVVLTFTRVYLHGLRKETLTNLPGRREGFRVRTRSASIGREWSVRGRH